MIEINGSHGEGGGQILRSALALSILTETPIRVTHIRANRPKPGLKPQHHTLICMLQTLSNAQTKGATIGSSTIEFHPSTIKEGHYQFSVGTAGSIVLIYQAILSASLRIKSSLSVTLTGGTDVKWSPSWDYFTNVFCPFLSTLGFIIESSLKQRGYYPKGGGTATLTIQPIETLAGYISSLEKPSIGIRGNIHSHGLPEHIATRMKHAVLKTMVNKDIPLDITLEHNETSSPGIVLTLWTRGAQQFHGCVGLGERGVRAETIGQHCIKKLLFHLNNNTTVDPWLFDQILLFLVCADGPSALTVPFISNHAQTNMWLIQQFFPNQDLFQILENENHYHIRIMGQNIFS